MDQTVWRTLHLRKARGETLSDEDERAYQAELARQEATAPPLTTDLAALKQFHDEYVALRTDNRDLRQRLTDLEDAIRRVEKNLSRETRQAIGITE